MHVLLLASQAFIPTAHRGSLGGSDLAAPTRLRPQKVPLNYRINKPPSNLRRTTSSTFVRAVKMFHVKQFVSARLDYYDSSRDARDQPVRFAHDDAPPYRIAGLDRILHFPCPWMRDRFVFLCR
jgi:hypothetical protein